MIRMVASTICIFVSSRDGRIDQQLNRRLDFPKNFRSDPHVFDSVVMSSSDPR